MKVELIKTLYKQMIIGIIQTPPAPKFSIGDYQSHPMKS